MTNSRLCPKVSTNLYGRVATMGQSGANVMKCKIFTGRRWGTVEKQAYDWLAAQKRNLELHLTETHMSEPIRVTLWYDVARSRPVSLHHPHRLANR